MRTPATLPPSRATRWLAALAGVTLATVACKESSRRDTSRMPVVTARTTGIDHAVEVTGLDGAALRRLSHLAPDDAAWSRLVAVYVERAGVDTASGASKSPPIIGRYAATRDGLRFEPRFPFASGVAYRAELDTAAIARLTARTADDTAGSSAPVVTYRFALPAVARSRTTRVVAIHPSADRLPSNLLRWYVEFSAPMEAGSALEHVHLLGESGREVPRAFLALDQELWDPERRRLTLLFDPGRVKRGVRTNLESGAPLVAGRRYRLVIDDGWRDGAGDVAGNRIARVFDIDRRTDAPSGTASGDSVRAIRFRTIASTR